MSRYLIGVVLFGLIIFTSMATTESNTTKESNRTNEHNKTKLLKTPLIVDLDREKEEQQVRGKVEDIIYGTLSIGDNNDEVKFMGSMLVDATNTIIIINDNAGELKREIKNSLTIKVSWLEGGDMVILKKENMVIMEKEVSLHNLLF